MAEYPDVPVAPSSSFYGAPAPSEAEAELDFGLEAELTEPSFSEPAARAGVFEAHSLGVAAGSELTAARSPLSQDALNDIELDFDELQTFETVSTQFCHLGVTFANAIALVPSNPAFPSHSGQLVLMGCPKGGWLEATFDQPVQRVSGHITSSRPTVMAAFDEHNRPVAQTQTPAANLAGSDSSQTPNLEMTLTARRISRVTFYTFDGQLTLGAFSFAQSNRRAS
ncbi:hypothetical protein [Thermoleptolyngbya sp. C42_A2020_037]|uniref:hypothetical protein n=1 Tax=Thermoleptolyngbya sp. C42_A2020_037 TaxID=2747799 RepID=UPI0019DA953C|nr:hypothetical protein [Thermoleptolyngbya sp. C42_A2020_037]MBF2085242.1 hypothetical protein [Thermoleptolyngbya sp. C42_A2020_037]